MRIPLVLTAPAFAFVISPSCPAQFSAWTGSALPDVQKDSIDPVAPAEPSGGDLPSGAERGVTQDEPAAAAARNDWRLDFTLWMWLTAMSGDLKTGPLSTSVDASFSDILEESDSLFALAGRIEGGKGRWGGFVEGMYSNIGADDQDGPVGLASVDVTCEIILLDFGMLFRVIDSPATNGGGRHNTIDLYAAGRYQDLTVELDPAIVATREGEADWIDPIFGARGTLQLTRHFDLTLTGDIGGFGVSSDLTWSARGVIGFHFGMFGIPTTLYAGYAALGTDYSEGSGLSRFEWDIILHGPALGITLSF